MIPTPPDQVWCHEHKHWEPRDDLVDFPVSADWRDFYFEQGMTPWPSPGYFNRDRNQSKGKVLRGLVKRVEPSGTVPASASLGPGSLRDRLLALETRVRALLRERELPRPDPSPANKPLPPVYERPSEP